MPPRDDAGAASATPRPMRSGCRSSAGSSPRRSRTIPIQKASRPGSSNAASAGPRLTRWARCEPWRETCSRSGGLLWGPPASAAGRGGLAVGLAELLLEDHELLDLALVLRGPALRAGIATSTRTGRRSVRQSAEFFVPDVPPAGSARSMSLLILSTRDENEGGKDAYARLVAPGAAFGFLRNGKRASRPREPPARLRFARDGGPWNLT